MSNYQYRIIDNHDQAVTDWVNTGDTEITLNNLSLETGKQYRFQVQANLSGGGTVSGASPGVIVDTTIPQITSLVTPIYSSGANLGFSWAATDGESGVADVWVALGSGYYRSDISGGWIRVSGTTSQLSRDVNNQPLNLASGARCYLTLRVYNGAGLETERTAAATIINNSAPPTPVVADQGDYINPDKQPLKANWVWTPFDPNGGIVSYQWALLPYSADINSANWNDAGQATAASLNAPELSEGTTYRFAVKATNQAGSSSIGYSDGITIDTNAPVIPEVELVQAINLGDNQEAIYITNTDNLQLIINSYDLNGITVYEYTYAKQSQIKNQNDYDNSATLPIAVSPILSADEFTVYKAVCSDGATNLSQTGYSTGVILDSGAPTISDVHGAVSGNMMFFDWDVVASVSPVVSYEYVLAPEARMNDTPGSWSNAKLNRSIAIDVSDLADGKYRLLVRSLNAAGTYSSRQRGEWGISPTIILDRQAPVMEAGQFSCSAYADRQIAVSAAARDDLSGIGGYQYALGTKTNPTLYSNGWVDVAGNNGTIQFDAPADGVAHNSLVYLMVRAKDNVGLWSTALVSQKILIDHTPPLTPAVTYGAYNTSKTQLNGVKFSSGDPESGVTYYRIGIATAPGQNWLPLEEAPIEQFKGTLTTSSLAEGQVFYIAVQTCNEAGTWSASGYSQSITVDTIPPVLSFTRGDQIIVLNTPPLNIEYTLSEAADVQFILSAADGTGQSSTANCQAGANSFNFNETKPQTYQLSAYAVDPAGNIGQSKTQSIRVNAPPQITLTPLSATPGAVLLFNAAVIDPDGHPVSYSWDPGDGGPTLSGVAVNHQYAATGIYTLTLTVTDNDGAVTGASTTVTVANTTQGTLYADETWSGTHYIYGDITIPTGKTLIVLPGTQIIVTSGAGAGYGIDVQGSLVIQVGAMAVIFRSAGGQVHSWKGIYLEGQATLNGVTIRDAERGLTVTGGATAVLDQCLFQNNQAGLHVYGSTPTVSNCSFLDNAVYGIKEDEGGRPLVNGCIFSANGMDYYSETETDLTIEELNQIPGNGGNQ